VHPASFTDAFLLLHLGSIRELFHHGSIQDVLAKWMFRTAHGRLPRRDNGKTYRNFEKCAGRFRAHRPCIRPSTTGRDYKGASGQPLADSGPDEGCGVFRPNDGQAGTSRLSSSVISYARRSPLPHLVAPILRHQPRRVRVCQDEPSSSSSMIFHLRTKGHPADQLFRRGRYFSKKTAD
jgi:hypothetical protein